MVNELFLDEKVKRMFRESYRKRLSEEGRINQREFLIQDISSALSTMVQECG